ncbi:MAG: hypothetical protein SFU99_04095 [Saprospiraceae bacterium]|nr:hypothetical protein [Saprospiraceae bacterium]
MKGVSYSFLSDFYGQPDSKALTFVDWFILPLPKVTYIPILDEDPSIFWGFTFILKIFFKPECYTSKGEYSTFLNKKIWTQQKV